MSHLLLVIILLTPFLTTLSSVVLLLTAERAELGGSLARGNGRGLGHAALVVAGFLELSVDNFLEMGFVALHGGEPRSVAF